MKMMKRVIALVLCLFMIVSDPINTFAQSGVTVGCSECGQSEIHAEICSQYVKANSENESIAENVDSENQQDIAVLEPTVPEITQDIPMIQTPEQEFLQEIPVEKVQEVAVPQVGDKIWIKNGSKVYKNYADSENGTHSLLGNYEVKIKQIILDEEGNPIWYEFEFTTIGIGETALLLGGYKYVQVENTSVEKPAEPVEPEKPSEPEAPETECTCGTEDENHAEDCPLYDDSGFDMVYIDYEDTAESGIRVNVSAPEDAFSERTTVSVRDVEIASEQVKAVVDEEILGIAAVDISFDGEQPTERVVVTLDIPESEIPEDANKVKIVHFGESGPEVVNSSYLDTSESGEVISFVTDGFSSYAAVFVNGKYSSQKMSKVLEGNERYSIVEFPVDLFDYDPVGINNLLNSVVYDEKSGFHFTGYGIAGMGSNSGINNSTADYAKQGILETKLEGGLPDFKHLTGKEGTDAGIETGKILFSDTHYQEMDAKTIYKDIPFEFVYDSNTGFYEYKSSANHAQLNESKTKVELYADTLSTNNSYAETLDLGTHHESNDLIDITVSGSSYKATVKNTVSETRLDPYVVFTVDNKEASDIGQIYVKAKVPESVRKNVFQLFFDTDKFKGMAEAKSYTIDYTANGDWIEFVVDTANCSEWKDTITNIRIDLFDENKDAPDNYMISTGEYEIEIAQISLINKNIDTTTTRGGFYPFSEIEDSYPGNNTAFNYESWEKLMQKSGVATARASRSIFNPSPASNQTLYQELAYGMVMEFDFYIPVDKSGENLTYYFNGDDDLWVFVDNQLVLDIGGGHGAITGTLNFTDGSVNVDSATTVHGYNQCTIKNDGTIDYGEKSGTMDQSLYSAGKHTMKVFYLERGGSVSNCYMKFNLPQTPQGSVKVTKEVVENNNADTSVLYKEKFEFQILMENKGAGNDYKVQAPLSEKDFYIVNADDSTADAKTDADGKFELTHGQEAVFEIAENYEVTVIESDHQIVGYDFISTTINGAETTAKELSQVTVKNEEKSFAFVNTYEEQQSTFTYIPINPTDCPDEVKGTVKLTGNDVSVTYEKEGVIETIGKRTGVPVGSTATDTTAVKFVGWYADESCTNEISKDEVFMPEKGQGSNLWEDKIYYAKFEYMYGDLKITKDGIETVDHDEVDKGNEEEKQSTIYNVVGTSNSGVAINMQVAICGNDSVTIKHLPVGTYKVTENTDWSWRYEPKRKDPDVDVVDGQTTESRFDNDRDRRYWLSGDCYNRNLFDDNAKKGDKAID